MYIDSVWSVIFSVYFGRTYFRPLGHKVPAEGRTGQVLLSRKFMGLLFYCLLKKSKQTGTLFEVSTTHLVALIYFLLVFHLTLSIPNKVKYYFCVIEKSFTNVEDVCRRSKVDQETVGKQIISCG